VSQGELENQAEIIAAQLAQGDDDAFWPLFEMFGPRLVGFYKRKGVADTDAEDLAWDCLQTVRRQIGKYNQREGSSFMGWVFTIARNKWIDRHRRNLTTIPLEDFLLNKPRIAEPRSLEPYIEPEEDQKSPDEISREFQDALERLSKNDQEVIRLRFIDPCHNNAELAARLGITENAAKQRLHRALKRLKPILENDPRIKIRK
jgi:RNA polymerase sigma-70 factor (ECF subfamily)